MALKTRGNVQEKIKTYLNTQEDRKIRDLLDKAQQDSTKKK